MFKLVYRVFTVRVAQGDTYDYPFIFRSIEQLQRNMLQSTNSGTEAECLYLINWHPTGTLPGV